MTPYLPAAAVWLAAAGPFAFDPELARQGAILYRSHCATCHGAEGHGDGPVADSLRVAPPDLTRIARRRGGKFPADEVARTIDGRRPARGHGNTQMPVWGDAFKLPEEGYSEERVKDRITLLVHFLASIQQADARR